MPTTQGPNNQRELAPGVIFPDYELPDQTGTGRKLSVLQGDDPMVLTLNRGYYCPKDRQQLLGLREFSDYCKVGFARLVTITTDALMQLNELRLGVGADWIFLSDEKRRIQQDWGIQEYTDSKNNPMIPYTLVLEPGLKIYKAYNGYWFWGRPTIHELHLDLRAISEKVRPDWKIDTPEIRARWERGEKDRFFPYGHGMKEVFARMSNTVDQF